MEDRDRSVTRVGSEVRKVNFNSFADFLPILDTNGIDGILRKVNWWCTRDATCPENSMSVFSFRYDYLEFTFVCLSFSTTQPRGHPVGMVVCSRRREQMAVFRPTWPRSRRRKAVFLRSLGYRRHECGQSPVEADLIQTPPKVVKASKRTKLS